jgi:pyruvate/2-oxoglutarate dehydrogenase complex dihydrolipoamide acyltransferase (E2) component
MPAFHMSQAGPFAGPDALRAALEAEPALNAAWRDGAVAPYDEVRIAVALPGPVFPVLGDYEALRARDPASFTAAEQSGATFTLWEVAADWFTPPLLPRQSGGLGVGRAGLTLACDARVVTPDAAARFLSAATTR